ncbi:VQ motif-containing protein 4 [Oryza sativa Japonica Group]|uniref:Os01g0201250 protein n=3 Tax=Oryza TaxID=4527 RepID=A0A0P0UZV8_ORYSJ|nr:VQ motif-containing protein 4 [Oryza sativa Japonica Group]XP_052150267.1 VQ motif-containing protein 4-like [Oryza glaberrima]KAF2948964.1 hypothetical protein DAI22_01g072000 [Oryza sativa Japonica Group]BAS70909.1 Os01g0201250 [Oryza sativa Japonica Group]
MATTSTHAPPPHSPLPLPAAAAGDPSNPFPTTFVQADTTSFKQVVQILTGTPETAAAAAAGGAAAAAPPPAAAKPAPAPPGPKKPAFKLYERRSSMKSLKMLCPLLPAAAAFAAGGGGGFSPSPRGFSPRGGGMEVLSPSMLDFPSLALGSPVTPLPPLPGSDEAAAAEDRAIAEKGFYLHPSPRGNAGAAGELQPPPRLLPLFPLQSPGRQ